MSNDQQPGMVTRGTIDLIGRQLGVLRGRGRGEVPLARRRRGMGGEGGGGEVDIKIVLIDADIDGVEEDEEATLDDEAVVYHDPPGTVVESLGLCAYARQPLDLKYYRTPSVDDPGFDAAAAKLILATEEVPDDPDTEDSPLHTQFATMSVYYDDKEDFAVGEYTKDDYPELGEEDDFPPTDRGTLPDGFFKRRFRGIAINGVLVLIFCQPAQPRPLPPIEE